MRVLLLILLIFLQGSFGAEDETKTVVRRQSVTLTCPIDAKNCGELHSIKWFKGTERIAVSSGDGKFSHVEGSIADRLSVEYAPNKIGSRLNIKAIQIEDEDVYMCEITYLEPLESCETTGEYSIDVKVTVPPSAILMLNNDEETIPNNTTIGPLREGHKFEAVCEVRGARPQPVVGWYRSGKRLADSEVIDEWNGLYTVKSKLSLKLSRQELGAVIECRVENTGLESQVSNHLYFDLHVRPTKINLIGVKNHAIDGAKVLLECQVYGARPAANVSWFNGTTMITDENEFVSISTKTNQKGDDTFETVSQMIFTATRFENGVDIRCEADNIVMRDDLEKPLHATHLLEVMYPPVIRVKPDNLTINETDKFILFCDYIANPATILSVRWLQNGGAINVNQPRFDGGNPEQTALVVKNSSRHDIGSYSCELSNEIGIGMSENQALIDIQFTPIVTIRLDPPSPIVEDHNVNVTLYCDVQSGNPSKLLKVQWMANGTLLKELPECKENEDATNFCTVDPTKMLLENVNREFLGDYSCRGYNAAGWGDESEIYFLDVYNEPGNAIISHFPLIPVKTKSMVLSCAVEDSGNPKSTRFRWLRGEKPVVDIVTSQWTIDPVGLDSRNNFSCFAFNEGGNGTAATINIDIQVAPWFINKLPQYTGFLYSEPAINLTCRVECVPSCSIFWFKDGEEISSTNDRYAIKEVLLPADTSTGDFESVLSELHFNMTNWEIQKLDVLKDSANYTCSSSNNSVGLGVRSATYFAVEFPPENVTVSHPEVFVNEGSIPARVLCSAKGLPEPNFHWNRFETNELVANGNALTVNKGLYRSDKGIYSCVAENKHGRSSVDILMNILYTPNCTIIKEKVDGEDRLSCIADGNPEKYDYVWDFKSENETGDNNVEFKKNNRKSYLVLSDDVHHKRVYRCRADNSVGAGTFCEISVDGHLMWWSQFEMMTLYIIAAVILACLIAVIILIIIIICMCRRRRKRSSKSMEKSLVENKPTDLNAEPNENYENLPFHGMQNPPTKSLKASDFDEFDGVYADLDDTNVNYGPINYKQASVYQFMKFKSPQR
ncbi:unnamed protein product [Diamesa tonsa]